MSYPRRLNLGFYSSTASCVEAIDKLHTHYKAVHKRKPSVDLFCSTTFGHEAKPEEGIKATLDTYAITLLVTDEATQAAEAKWFEQSARLLSPSSAPSP